VTKKFIHLFVKVNAVSMLHLLWQTPELHLLWQIWCRTLAYAGLLWYHDFAFDPAGG
jgi:hypothetical protein